MIIFTLRRLLLLLITLFFLTFVGFQPELFHPSCPTAGRFPVECVAVLV
ncbi:antimicrobial peptide ABC transporter permease SapB [Klebsiella pneumoniae]|uniref:Antimicrobial peptide ABC transporter permease SapB n=1 Tax=Klebsiella pneumoniae TaxID=573 RepID=A0A2X3C9P4_KLEPN|nr:antimicrobial peptide ABC transporter permease SapB [Klebsiella pneumoniae]